MNCGRAMDTKGESADGYVASSAPVHSFSSSIQSTFRGCHITRRPHIVRTLSNRPQRRLAVRLCVREDAANTAEQSASPQTAGGSFGRQERFPLRLVGLYEIGRLRVDASKIFAPNEGSQCGFAIPIALFVIATFVVPAISSRTRI